MNFVRSTKKKLIQRNKNKNRISNNKNNFITKLKLKFYNSIAHHCNLLLRHFGRLLHLACLRQY
jgi:hypothetical protein